jgi:TPR repeat protein
MRILLAAILLMFSISSVQAAPDPEGVTQCDVLASHGSDPERVSPGVSQSGMRKSAAIAACLAATDEQPNNRRLRYLLGRAYFYSGRPDDAMPHLIFSADAGHRQAQFVVGYIYDGGLQGITQDRCKAEELWLRSARQGRFAALVSYPHHVVRGMFDDCDVSATKEEMAGFLETAKGMASDYYRRTWTADVTADFEANR